MDARAIDLARTELSKLPQLGPVFWLFAKDPLRKFTFACDLEWRLMPPLILDQHRTFYQFDVPWAYCSWALVSDEVQSRLESGVPALAPHEWNSGKNAWLIDVVSPFGDSREIASRAVAEMPAVGRVKAWLVDPDSGRPCIVEFEGRRQ